MGCKKILSYADTDDTHAVLYYSEIRDLIDSFKRAPSYTYESSDGNAYVIWVLSCIMRAAVTDRNVVRDLAYDIEDFFNEEGIISIKRDKLCAIIQSLFDFHDDVFDQENDGLVAIRDKMAGQSKKLRKKSMSFST